MYLLHQKTFNVFGEVWKHLSLIKSQALRLITTDVSNEVYHQLLTGFELIVDISVAHLKIYISLIHEELNSNVILASIL